MKKNEAYKSLKYYQSLADAFHTGAADCVPVPLDITKFKVSHNEFNIYCIIINHFRFILPLYVSDIPHIETTIQDLSDEAAMTYMETEVALQNLEKYHNLIEIDRQEKKLSICLLDITQVASRKRGS